MSSGYIEKYSWYPPAETRVPLSAVQQSLQSSTKEAIEALCREVQCKYCVFGPSGRTLLFNLLSKLSDIDDVEKNEVLIPAYTCYSVAASIVKAGLKIRLYDIDPGTLSPNYRSLKSNIGGETLAVLTQHLFGISHDLDIVAEILSDHRVYHIEDAAQAFGSIYQDKAVGTTADFGLFSFGRGKPLPLGGAGALVSNHHNLNKLLPINDLNYNKHHLINTLLTQMVAKPYLYLLAEMLPLGLGDTIFNPDFEPGATPIAFVKLFKPMMAHFSKINIHRNSIASIYQQNIKAEALISTHSDRTHVYTRFPILARAGEIPRQLRRLGVRRLYPNALHKEPKIKAFSQYAGENLSGAEFLAEKLITLPTHHAINNKTAAGIAIKTNRWIN